MIKIPIAFLFTLSFSHLTSCNIKKTPAISTLHIDNLTYSSYRWRHSKADTGSELFIDNYLFINGDVFIPGDSPPILQDLSSKLDSIIFNSNISSGVFSLEKYSKILTKRSLANSGGLPILQSPNIEIK